MIELGAWTPTPPVALAVLFLAGHFLADFLFQTREGVEAKNCRSGLIHHGVVVFISHMVLVIPMWSWTVTMGVVAITLAHVAIDWGKTRYLSVFPGRLTAFTLDQVAHLLVAGGVWALIVHWTGPAPVPWIGPSALGTISALALLAAAFAFNGTGGSVIVEGVLGHLPSLEAGGNEAGGTPGAGRRIGILERTLVLALVLYQQWAAMALLVTAKSIARFEELKVRRFAEYYLIGTLTSLLVSLGVAFLLTGIVIPALF